MYTSAEKFRNDSHNQISQVIDERFQNRNEFYFGASSVFLQKDASNLAWHWVNDRVNNISGTTYQWSKRDRPHRIHRLLLVRDPAEISNVFLRANWQRVFRTFCHLHMWDGAVLYVIFLTTSVSNYELLANEINFSYFSGELLFPLDNYWKKDYQPRSSLSGSDSFSEVKRRLLMIPNLANRKTIKVWYDPEDFQASRRPKDALYRAQRKLVCSTYAGECQAPRGSDSCKGRIDLNQGHLDHIISIRKSNNCLLNLSWLCDKCNLQKGNLDTYALPMQHAIAGVPSHLSTRDLEKAISFTSPAWLSRFQGKPDNVLRHFLRKK